jgi:aldehyde dehydrogenase (NAD+)
VQTYNHFIDNQWVAPAKGKWLETVNPYTGEAWARIPEGTVEDVKPPSAP